MYYNLRVIHLFYRHIQGLNLEQFQSDKIDLLITNSNNVGGKYTNIDKIDKTIDDNLQQCLKEKGRTIIVCSNLSRIYEVLITIRDFWIDNQKNPTLYWLKDIIKISIFHNFSYIFIPYHSAC